MAVKTLKGRPAWGGVVEGYAFVCPNSIQGWSSIDVNTGVVLEKGHVHEGGSFAGKFWWCHAAAAPWAGPTTSASAMSMV